MLTRRKLLQGAGLVATAAITGCRTSRRFNLLLHGLMVHEINATDKTISIHMPICDGHVFCLTNPGLKDQVRTDQTKDGQLRLTGPSPYAGMKRCSDGDNAMLHRQEKYPFPIDPSKRKVQLTVPWPNEIVGFRRARLDTAMPLFTGDVATDCKVKNVCMPLVYAFRYHDAKDVQIVCTDGKALWTAPGLEADAVNVHAEPLCPKMGDNHLHCLTDMLGITGKLMFNKPDGMSVDPITPGDGDLVGVYDEDLYGLSHAPGHVCPLSIDPGNCGQAFVDG